MKMLRGGDRIWHNADSTNAKTFDGFIPCPRTDQVCIERERNGHEIPALQVINAHKIVNGQHTHASRERETKELEKTNRESTLAVLVLSFSMSHVTLIVLCCVYCIYKLKV